MMFINQRLIQGGLFDVKTQFDYCRIGCYHNVRHFSLWHEYVATFRIHSTIELNLIHCYQQHDQQFFQYFYILHSENRQLNYEIGHRKDGW